MTSVSALFRHPIKSHGREALQTVALVRGQSMPMDRQWAVAHDASDASGEEWVSCANFSRAAKAPALMAIESMFDPASETLTLSHPDRPDLVFDPDTEAQAFLDWVAPLVPAERAKPARILRLAQRGFTDSDFPSVTLCNTASHKAVEESVGQSLSLDRWRGNIWFDTGNPWEEFDWIGREIRVGTARLLVRERTGRCLATAVNPETGKRDIDTLGALQVFGHQDFSVRAEVIESGTVTLGDPVELS